MDTTVHFLDNIFNTVFSTVCISCKSKEELAINRKYDPFTTINNLQR